MKVGARMLKTGLAIMLALFLTPLLGLDTPLFAGIAATFAIQPSIYRTYNTLIDQTQANIIGAIVAIVFVLAFGNDPFIVGLAAIIVIAVNVKLKTENMISIALVTLVAIMQSPAEDFINYALIRFAAIMVGIFSAFLINLAFIPPKYENKLYHKINENTEGIIKLIRLLTRQTLEHNALKEEIERLKDSMIKMDHFYLLYKEERSYFKKQQYAKARRVVLFRQMLVATNRALDILKKLHRYENEFSQLPDELQAIIQEQLDMYLHYHEQILMKFVGKIRPDLPAEIENQYYEQRESLIEAYMKYYQEEKSEHHEDSLHLFPVISVIVEYEEQLERLSKLMDSFQTYHKEENEVTISDRETEF